MKRLQNFDGQWDSSVAAIEMLAVGAALAGRPQRASATLAEWLNALFEEWPTEISAQSPGWKRLYQSVLRNQSRLKDMALARASGTKGGQRGAFIDPSKIVQPLRRIRRRWELIQHPPDGAINLRDDYGALATLYNGVAAELAGVAKAEWVQRTDWVAEWHDNVPQGWSRKEVVDVVRELLDVAMKNGIGFTSRVRDSISSALSDLESVQLDDALRTAAALRDAEEPVKRLPELGLNRGSNARAAVRIFLPAVHGLLNELEASVASRIANIDQGHKDLQEHQSDIKNALHQLSRDLEVIGGVDAGTN